MKRDTILQLGIILCGLIPPSAFSHPFDSPLTFRPHKSDQGGTVYSNIPKKCFSNGVLLCAGLHPVIGGGNQQPVPPAKEFTIDTKD